MESTGVGRISGKVKTADGKFVSVSFNDVLIVPDLERSLLSVKRVAVWKWL